MRSELVRDLALVYQCRLQMIGLDKLLWVSAICMLLCYWTDLSMGSDTQPELNTHGTWWQRLKNGMERARWPRIKPVQESPATIQSRRELWQGISRATLL